MSILETKGVLASKTVWGNALVLLPALAALLEQVGVIPPGTVDQLMVIASSIAGSVLGLYGRIKAATKISGLL